jgi:hypothetical protein
MTTLNELYQEIILDHYRQPRGRGELEPPKITQEGFKPLLRRRDYLGLARAGRAHSGSALSRAGLLD